MRLKPNVFIPFCCDNPDCHHIHNEADFIENINNIGLIYAEYGSKILIGITCDKCRQASLIEFDKADPIIDLTNMIMLPAVNRQYEVALQLIELVNRPNKPNSLHYSFISVFENDDIDFKLMGSAYDYYIENIIKKENAAAHDLGDRFELIPTHIFPDSEPIETRLIIENTTNQIVLKRLFTNTPQNRCLAECMSHPKTYKTEPEDPKIDLREYFAQIENPLYMGGGSASILEHTYSAREKKERNASWLKLLEYASGNDLLQDVTKFLIKKKALSIDQGKITEIVDTRLEDLHLIEAPKLRERSTVKGFEYSVWEHLRLLYGKVFSDVCTNAALYPQRNELKSWVQNAKSFKKPTAVFVDAPMGLGKTTSIISSFVDNTQLSAVIFMPTIALCEEIVESLKTEISRKRGTLWKDYYSGDSNYYNRQTACDIDGEIIFNPDGFPKDKWVREFLKEEVYFKDGINSECVRQYEIYDRYKKKTYEKSDFCNDCEKADSCRFKEHLNNAPKSRVIVTTHHQYDLFHSVIDLQMWYKGGKKDEAVQRDFFIIDEDFVMLHCYSPLDIAPKQFNEFYDFYRNNAMSMGKISYNDILISFFKLVVDNINNYNEDFVFPPIKKGYSFSGRFHEVWKLIIYRFIQKRKENLSEKDPIPPNYLDYVEAAIKYGFVIKGYNNNKRIILPNPKQYDLSDKPMHVFFDGTKLDDKYLKRKLHNVGFNTMSIQIKPIWDINIHQNIWSDVTASNLELDRPKVESLIKSIIQQCGINRKYFVLSKLSVMNKYLRKWLAELQEQFPGFQYVAEHYGNLRGKNNAKDCDACIMIGSYNIPTSTEVGYALELISGKISTIQMPIKDNLFTFGNINSIKKYKDEFQEIEDLSRALRLNEHRQGLARTRYYFHDVDFFVISKDRVDEYEPNLPHVITTDFAEEFFHPMRRASHPSSKHEIAERGVYELLQTQNTVNATQLARYAGISNHTASKHLKRMRDEGKLVQAKIKQYALDHDSRPYSF